jgi:hypothetical protein
MLVLGITKAPRKKFFHTSHGDEIASAMVQLWGKGKGVFTAANVRARKILGVGILKTWT